MCTLKIYDIEVEPEEVLRVLAISYSITPHSPKWIWHVFERAYDEYNAARSMVPAERKRWLDKHVAVYQTENELPGFIKALGGKMIKNALKRAAEDDFLERRKSKKKVLFRVCKSEESEEK